MPPLDVVTPTSDAVPPFPAFRFLRGPPSIPGRAARDDGQRPGCPPIGVGPTYGPPPDPSSHLRRVPTLPHHIAIAGRSDVGKLRRRNEDSVVVLPDLGIAIVADGMGGHPGGDVASRLAAEACARHLGDAVESGGADDDFVERFRTTMEGAVLEAHRRIREHGSVEPHLEGMGTTLTAMITHPASGAWVIGHVGDSRAYRLRGGELEQLTRDDTWVQEQIDRGEMQAETARLSPYAHLLTQCVGLEDRPDVQILEGAGESGDLYLLCTDGLVGMLDDARLARILGDARPDEPPDAADVHGPAGTDEAARIEALLDAANEAGGHDNITAALVRFG